jgi:hypothetical protein
VAHDDVAAARGFQSQQDGQVDIADPGLEIVRLGF